MTTILNKEKILEQARIFADEGKYDKAITEYEKILMADPSDLRVKLRVAELYTKRKQIGEAIRIYREVASSYSNEGFYLKAVTVLKNVLRLNPTLVDINQMLAELYERMGLTQDSIRQYSILATTLDQKGDGEKALEIRKKIVELDSGSEDARVKLAEILQREGKTEEAAAQYEELAKIYELQGKKDLKLADMYEKVLAHKEDVAMLKALCRIYDELGEKKKVLKWVEQTKGLAATDPELLLMLARIYASLNQIETARSKYLALAEVEKNEGHIEGALAAYAEIMMLIPGEDEKIYKRAEELREGAVDELKVMIMRRRREQKEQAEAERKEADKKREEEKKKQVAEIKAKPKSPPPVSDEVKFKIAESAFDLGNAYWKMGLTDEAKTELEKAHRIYKEIVVGGGKGEAKARQRLDAIDALLKKKGEHEPEVKIEKKVEPELIVEEKSEPIVKVEKKNKKISFV